MHTVSRSEQHPGYCPEAVAVRTTGQAQGQILFEFLHEIEQVMVVPLEPHTAPIGDILGNRQ